MARRQRVQLQALGAPLKAALVALAGAAALGAALAARAAEPPGGGLDVEHYEVTLRPDFEAHALTGRTDITVRSRRDGLAALTFSPNRLVIDGATVDGHEVAPGETADALSFALPRPLRAGEAVTLSVAFHGVPARGMVFGRRSVTTRYFTCDWMICAQDRPGDKATLTLSLELPPGMTSIGPGVLAARERRPDGLLRHVWRETQAYSAYVFGFAAGDFHVLRTKARGRELLALSEDAPPARLSALFAPTAEMARYFERRAGLPLPHGRYVQVHVAGDEAQEAAGFSVLGEDVLAARLDDPHEDWAIAHELAHQWWGNRVTCADWSQFWLNEGITSFMVAAWKEERWGRAAYEREMDLFRRRRETAVKAGMDVPLTYPGPYPSLALRRAVTYSKAALFLDVLRKTVGERAFWRGLRNFTRAHSGNVVDSHDFQRAMEGASGRSLDSLFGEWVTSPR